MPTVCVNRKTLWQEETETDGEMDISNAELNAVAALPVSSKWLLTSVELTWLNDGPSP